jgi:hypothetical protein
MMCEWGNFNITYFATFITVLRLTHSMEQSSSWEANRHAASQEIPPHFIEPEGSLPHSQVPATCPYTEPARSSPYTTSHWASSIQSIPPHHTEPARSNPYPHITLSQLDPIHTPTSHWASSIQSIHPHHTEPARSSPCTHIPLPEHPS